MATQTEPQIILYDLACTKNVCFSPVVWRVRLMLNYKQIPYQTVFLEFPDIEPTLKGFGIAPHPSEPGPRANYTVPAIKHVPTDTYMMDSAPIAQFLESTYPTPPVPLTSELGSEIEAKSRTLMGAIFGKSVMYREVHILSPRAADYFRRIREARFGVPLEAMLDVEKEDETWAAMDATMQDISRQILTNKTDGPFVLGPKPSYTDFFIAGFQQCARVVDEGVFQRVYRYPGFKDVYDACGPYMARRD